ncbi:MAG: branched-chain amino acid transport system II carrier protein [Parachlamydia sp.]|jgi:LIVCS family branched-chain amino acid:cation transporter|nr:branched-chain amino acid transport system II carrier protein [Parachlamydia sp.]
MNQYKMRDCFAAGLALFGMFFGAGNIIFPLALGKQALEQTPWGLSGLLLTAVAMPFAGLLAMFRFKGDVTLFFGRLGKRPGLIVATLIISLLGPFGAAPRCIALAHSTLSLTFFNIPLILFCAAACGLIFFFTYKENQLLKILGYILSPLKIGLLLMIIFKGFMEAPESVAEAAPSMSYFWHGLKEGYNTMDLLAAFFFAPILLASLGPQEENQGFLLKASGIGAFLLAAVYAGFCFLAYFYAAQLEGISSDQLLGAIAMRILGAGGGVIVGLTVTIACLTTSIALIAAFARFIQKELLKEKIGYVPVLSLSLLLTFMVGTFNFQGIAYFLNPILEVGYPVLILLTFYNLLIPCRSEETYDHI